MIRSTDNVMKSMRATKSDLARQQKARDDFDKAQARYVRNEILAMLGYWACCIAVGGLIIYSIWKNGG